MRLAAKLEQAIGAIVSDAIDIAVFYGADADDQVRPCVVCQALEGREDMQGLGNYWMRFRVVVKSNLDKQASEDPVADHDARWETVLAALNTDTLAADLTAAVADFGCMFVRNLSQESEIEGRCATDAFLGEAYVCPSDLS